MCPCTEHAKSTVLALGEWRCWNDLFLFITLFQMSLSSGVAGIPQSWKIVGGQKALGQNVWLLGIQEARLYTGANGTLLPKSGCDLAAIGLAYLFFLFFNKIFVALSQSRVAVVIMMPWNLGTRFSVARSIPIEYQAGLESPRGLTFWFFGDSWEEREESTVGVH